MIRVAQVVRPATGGIRRHVSSILMWLDRLAFAPTLIAAPEFTLHSGCEDIPRIGISIGAATSPFRDIRAIVRLSRLLRGGFDLVHAHGLRGALIGVPAARIARIPALFTAHNLVRPASPVVAAALRYLSGRAGVISVSHAVAATLMALGIGQDRIHVIPNGVDLAEFDTPSAPEEARRSTLADIVARADWTSAPDLAAWLLDPANLSRQIVVVGGLGRLSREKGFDVLLTAFMGWKVDTSEVAAGPRRLLILGGCGAEQPVLIQDARGGADIVLAGNVSNVTAFLSVLDIVSVPSREEGQGIVALEAMAATRPVIASRVGGLCESVIDRESGLLVPPEDPETLCSALARLAADPDLRRRFGAAGRSRVERCYSLDGMMEQLTGLYRATAEPLLHD